MSDNVVSLHGQDIVYDKTHIDPDDILENNKGEYENVLILGWARTGFCGFARLTASRKPSCSWNRPSWFC